MQEIFTESPSLSLPEASVRVTCLRDVDPYVRWWSADGNLLWDSNDIGSFRALKMSVCRTTVLENGEGGKIAMPEHLSPLFLAWPGCAFDIRPGAEELPLLDGSAYSWYKLLRSPAGALGELSFYDAPLRTRFEWESGFCEIRPAETFEVEYSLRHGAYADSFYAAIYDAEDLFPILCARTFIFRDDYERAMFAGLLGGAASGCGILLNVNSTGALEALDGGPFRFPQEPLMHKVLDLIGDISLPRPVLPRLRIRIHNGGHVAHHEILKRLLDYVTP